MAKAHKPGPNHPWKKLVLAPKKTDAEICETERYMSVRDYQHKHRRR